MPSSVPLINAIAQNSVDFNNQTPINAGGLFRYKIKNIGYPSGGAYILTPEDLNSVLIFSGDVTLILSSTYFVASGFPPAGSEILFYSTGGAGSEGRVFVSAQSNFVLSSYVGPYLQSSNDTGKIIYTGLNGAGQGNWTFASPNYNFTLIDLSDCCAGSAVNNLYQISTPTSTYNTSYRSYFENNFVYPYNGVINYDGSAYAIVNGYFIDVAMLCGDTEVAYTSAYTFYDASETSFSFFTDASDLDPTNYENLLGHKFFIGAAPNEGLPMYSCFSDGSEAGAASAVEFYGSVAQIGNSDPVTFYKGYVVNYDGIPTTPPA